MNPIDLFTEPLGFILGAIVLGLVVMWVTQFVRLMALKEEAFNGPHDRYAWVAAFLLLWPLAPLAFTLWAKDATRRSSRR